MDTFQALAEPRRRAILELLAQKGGLSSTQISTNFKISAPAVSQHLKVLREAHLVDMEKRAQTHIYTINEASLKEIENWTKKINTMWDQKLDRLDEILKKEVNKK